MLHDSSTTAVFISFSAFISFHLIKNHCILFCPPAGEQCSFQLCHYPLRETRMTANLSMNSLSFTCFCRIIKSLSYLVLLRLHVYQNEMKMIGVRTRCLYCFCFLELKGYFLQYFKCLRSEYSKERHLLCHIIQNFKLNIPLKCRKLLMRLISACTHTSSTLAPDIHTVLVYIIWLND